MRPTTARPSTIQSQTSEVVVEALPPADGEAVGVGEIVEGLGEREEVGDGLGDGDGVGDGDGDSEGEGFGDELGEGFGDVLGEGFDVSVSLGEIDSVGGGTTDAEGVGVSLPIPGRLGEKVGVSIPGRLGDKLRPDPTLDALDRMASPALPEHEASATSATAERPNVSSRRAVIASVPLRV